MPPATHDALRHQEEHSDHHKERADGFVLSAAFEEPSLELAEDDIREFLNDSDDEAAEHRAVRRSDAADNHRSEDEEQDEKAQQREHVSSSPRTLRIGVMKSVLPPLSVKDSRDVQPEDG